MKFAFDMQIVYAYGMVMEEWRILPANIKDDFRRAYLRLHGSEMWGEGDGREIHHT